jgi:hypothetical protein
VRRLALARVGAVFLEVEAAPLFPDEAFWVAGLVVLAAFDLACAVFGFAACVLAGPDSDAGDCGLEAGLSAALAAGSDFVSGAEA